MDRKKNRAAIVCLAILLSGGWVALVARSASPEIAKPPTAGPGPSFLDDPNLAGQTELSLGSRELFFKMMLSVGLVAILGIGALYLSKRVLPKIATVPGKEIHILETTYLGPRRALHLVEVGNHRLLIGSTNENITALAHVTDAWLDVARQEIDEAVKL